MTDNKFKMEYQSGKPGNGLGRFYIGVNRPKAAKLNDESSNDWEGSRTPFTLEEFIDHVKQGMGKMPGRFYFEHPITDADMNVVMEMKRRSREHVGVVFEVMPTFMNADVGFSVRNGKIIVTRSRATAVGFQITL